MHQKKRRKLRASDILLVLLCLSVCATSLWFFWKDLNSSSTRNDIEKIATIHFKRNISQRKFNDRVVWERLQQDSELYNNDVIRTSDGAEAVVMFSDGTKVDLNENTMIQVMLDKDGSVNLSISGGNVDVDTTASKSEAVKLNMGDGSSVSLEKGSRVSAVAATGDGGAASSITVQDGNAVVSTAGGESQKISNGEAVSIEKNGELSRQTITVTSIPKNLSVYKTSKEMEPVTLAWQTSENNLRAVAEVALDKAFENLISRQTAQGSSSVKITPKADEKKLYWRVYPQDEKEKAVNGQITIVELTGAVITSPLDNSVFGYRTEPPSLRFNWNEAAYAESYKIEVSRTSDFNSPVISERVKATSYSDSSLEKGLYYWRVTPYYSVNDIGYALPSATNSFEIEEREALSVPALTLPADTARIVLGEAEQNVIFSWKSDVKNADYNIQISQSPDFEKVLQNVEAAQTTVGKRFNINTLPEGTYYWKVLRNSAEDREASNEFAESSVRSFTVAKYVPGINRLVYPPDNYLIEEKLLPRMSFSWKLASEYKGAGAEAVLQISENSAFNNPLIQETLSASDFTGAKLTDGTYYWRVGVLRDGNIEALSDSRSFRVTQPFAAPQIIQPQNAEKLVVAYKDSLAVEWNEVYGADYYKLVIYDDEDKPYKTEKVSDTKLRLNLPMKDDTEAAYTKYKLSLQAYSEETDLAAERTGAQSSVSFEVRRPIPVRLVSPADNQSYDGLTALRVPVQFSWTTGDTPVRQTFILQRQNANGSWRTVRTIENPKNSVSLNRLTEGRYRWSISASGENGISLDSSSEVFIIRAVPLLAGAVLSEPERNLKMDSAYLKNHRSLSFKWKKVSGATDYDFAVYQVMPGGTYKKVYSQSNVRQTEIRIKDLSIFDVGTFEWRVTAYSHAKDGFEEQKGNVASSRFTIDFVLPSKVKTENPGTMFGE